MYHSSELKRWDIRVGSAKSAADSIIPIKQTVVKIDGSKYQTRLIANNKYSNIQYSNYLLKKIN